MPRLDRKFNYGDKLRTENKDLYNMLTQTYEDVSGIVNTKASKLILNGSNPPPSGQVNANYAIGDLAIRQDTNTVWCMSSRTTAMDVTWTQIS